MTYKGWYAIKTNQPNYCELWHVCQPFKAEKISTKLKVDLYGRAKI